LSKDADAFERAQQTKQTRRMRLCPLGEFVQVLRFSGEVVGKLEFGSNRESAALPEARKDSEELLMRIDCGLHGRCNGFRHRRFPP